MRWPEVLAHKWVVVLGEAGSGKTHEFRHQAESDLAQGPSFFLELTQLAENGVEDALGVAETERLTRWKDGPTGAVLFLDSLDEAKLARRTIATTVSKLSRFLQEALSRVQLVVSCRASDWRSADRDLLAELMRKELHLQVAPEVLVVALTPLKDVQVRSFAIHQQVKNIDGFMKAIEEANARPLAERPQDVTWLVNYWNQRGYFASLRDLIESSIDLKLTEKADRARSLSLDRARRGATQLAGASLLAGKRAFVVSPEVEIQTESTSVDPRLLLKDWCDEDIRALLTLPMFDPASYGRVRIHHRTVNEYLTAKWLLALRTQGLTKRDLVNLLFRDTENGKVVPPYLRPTIAWLSLWDQNVRENAMAICPEALLDEGDPSGFASADKEKILSNFAAKYADRNRLDFSYDKAGLRRFGVPALAPTILSLLISGTDELKELLLKMIEAAELSSCARAALEIACSSTEATHVRFYAVRATAATATAADLRELVDRILAERSVPAEIAGALVELMFPQYLDLATFISLLAKTEIPSRNVHTSLDYFLTKRLPQDVSSPMRAAILRHFLQLHSKLSSATEAQRRNWLVTPIADFILAMIEHDVELDHSLITDAIATLEVFPSDPWIHIKADEIRKAMAHHAELRRALFWKGVRALDSKTPRSTRFYEALFKPYRAFELQPADEEWLLQDALDVTDIHEKLLALDCAIWVHPAAQRTADWTVGLETSLQKQPSLLKHLRRSLSKQPPQTMANPFKRQQLARHRREQKDIQISKHNLLEALPSIRSGENYSALEFLYFYHTDRSFDGGELSLKSITRSFGAEVASAFTDGLQIFWTTLSATLPSERASGDNGLPNRFLVGLAGLNLYLQNEANLSKLTEGLAERAFRLAAWQLNKMPDWANRLADVYPDALRRAYGKGLISEYNALSYDSLFVLGRLLSPDSRLRRVCLPIVVDAIKLAEPASADVLETALACILVKSDEIDSEFKKIIASRARCSVNASPTVFVLWWYAWAHYEADDAMSYLEELIRQISFDQAKEILTHIAERISDWSERSMLMVPVFKDNARALMKMIPLAYKYIPKNEDLRHEGMHAVTPRDRAQRFRDMLVTWLTARPSREAGKALRSLAEDPSLVDERDWLLIVADRVGGNSLGPTPIQDMISIASHGWVPSNARELYRMVLDRLDDLKTDMEKGDFSLRSVFQKTKDESIFQKWTAKNLQDQSRGHFNAIREEEVDNDKKPDIRIHNSEIAAPIGIEIKVVDSWSHAQLVDALRGQLVRDYLRSISATFGVLLLYYIGEKASWQPTGRHLVFDALVDDLRLQAESLVDGKNVEGLSVVAIDCRSPVKNC
jgi:hypothetical protein